MSSQKFFRFPWATTGDKAAIPDTTQPGGEVSYNQGFGPDYELDPVTQPSAKRVPRDETNQVLYDVTANLRQYQIMGTPEWVTAAQNGGVSVSYGYGARVLYDDGSGFKVYGSLVANNVALPTDTTQWQIIDSLGAATNAETIAGTIATKAVTPASLNARTATDTRTGIVELATVAETIAGADATRAVTPAGLAGKQTGFLNVVYITANGNFNVPAGVTKLFAKVIGAGGGGGGASAAWRHGGGGGAGGVAEGVMTVTPGAVLAAVVGVGGTGGTLAPTVGGDGGSSSFNGFSATGGTGGTAVGGSGTGGVSGVGSGGGLNYGLGDGAAGSSSTDPYAAGVGGGAGGKQGQPGRAPGAGGGGGYDSGGAGSVSGGAGANGLIEIWY